MTRIYTCSVCCHHCCSIPVLLLQLPLLFVIVCRMAEIAVGSLNQISSSAIFLFVWSPLIYDMCTGWQYCIIYRFEIPLRHPRYLCARAEPKQASARRGDRIHFLLNTRSTRYWTPPTVSDCFSFRAQQLYAKFRRRVKTHSRTFCAFFLECFLLVITPCVSFGTWMHPDQSRLYTDFDIYVLRFVFTVFPYCQRYETGLNIIF